MSVTAATPEPEVAADAPVDAVAAKAEHAVKTITGILRLAELIPHAKSAPGRKAQEQAVEMMINMIRQTLNK